MINYIDLTTKLEKNGVKEKLHHSCSGSGRISRNFNNFVADNCSITSEDDENNQDIDNE